MLSIFYFFSFFIFFFFSFFCVHSIQFSIYFTTFHFPYILTNFVIFYFSFFFLVFRHKNTFKMIKNITHSNIFLFGRIFFQFTGRFSKYNCFAIIRSIDSTETLFDIVARRCLYCDTVTCRCINIC